MILISYDIADDKLRRQFSQYIMKYGHRIQYSVFEIDNSPRILKVIITDIKTKFEKRFGEADSIMIMNLSKSCEILKYGYAKHEDEQVIII